MRALRLALIGLLWFGSVPLFAVYSAPVFAVEAVSANIHIVETANTITTGADTIFVCASSYGTTAAPTMSDTINGSASGNAWLTSPPTARLTVGSARVQMFYAQNPNTGANHKFKITGNVSYPAIAVIGFSGGHLTAAYDVEAGTAFGSSSTIQPGAVDATEADSLIVSCLAWANETTDVTINSSFTISNQSPYTSGVNFGVALAYRLVDTSVNPIWTFPTLQSTGGVNIAAFKPSTGGPAAAWPQGSQGLLLR